MQTINKFTGTRLVVGSILIGCLLALDTLSSAADAEPPIGTPSPAAAANSSSGSRQQAPPPAAALDTGSSAFTRGMDAYRKGDLENARKLLAEAATAEPQNGDAQAVLGYLLAQAGLYDEALPHLEKALTMHPISISATNSRMNLGKSLLMRPDHSDSDVKRAVTLFEEAAQLSPHSEDVQLTLGYGYTRAQEYDKAVVAYRHATALSPTDAAAWKDLGLALRKTGPVGEAITVLKKSSELSSSDPEIWANLGDAYMDRAETPSALAAFNAGLKASPNNVPILIRVGNLNLRLLHFAEAGEAYGAAADKLEVDPSAGFGVTAAALRYDEGSALANAGRLNEAEAAYEKALSLDPKYTDALLNSGSVLYKQGKIDAAIGRFRRVTEIKPESEVGWKNLAAAADHNHDTEIAVTAWRHAVAINPASYDSRDRFASAILTLNPTSDDAAKQYSAMEHLRPHAAEASINLGLLYQRQAEAAPLASTKQAKLVLAMTSFLEAIRRDPKSAIAYNDLGVVHERRGEIPEAIAAYEKAVTIDPRLADARTNLARFHTSPTPPAGKPR